MNLEIAGTETSKGELILYTTEDGKSAIQLQASEGTVWLSQSQLTELFQTSKQNISLHLKNLFGEGELVEDSVVKYSLTTAEDSKNYRTKFYNLEAILAVGYRVRSPRGTQFRRWATTILKEYLVKGFALDDVRLKQDNMPDYFDELLERLRDIRASEKRFYQKICDIYATASDYDKDSEAARLFFKKVQNKMLFAETGKTAAELIVERSNPAKPNMGLTSWKGTIVRKGDVDIAKNYLTESEISSLNHIVTMYLDYGEDQARRRKTMTMAEWETKLDSFLEFNEREVLKGAGHISAQRAKNLSEQRYEDFAQRRKQVENEKADAEHLKEIENIQVEANKIKNKRKSK